jgi:hypothetical protein
MKVPVNGVDLNVAQGLRGLAPGTFAANAFAQLLPLRRNRKGDLHQCPYP